MAPSGSGWGQQPRQQPQPQQQPGGSRQGQQQQQQPLLAVLPYPIPPPPSQAFGQVQQQYPLYGVNNFLPVAHPLPPLYYGLQQYQPMFNHHYNYLGAARLQQQQQQQHPVIPQNHHTHYNFLREAQQQQGSITNNNPLQQQQQQHKPIIKKLTHEEIDSGILANLRFWCKERYKNDKQRRSVDNSLKGEADRLRLRIKKYHGYIEYDDIDIDACAGLDNNNSINNLSSANTIDISSGGGLDDERWRTTSLSSAEAAQQIRFVIGREINAELLKCLNPDQFKIIKLSEYQKALRDEFIQNNTSKWKTKVVNSDTWWKFWGEGGGENINSPFCRRHGFLLRQFMPALTCEVVGDPEATFVPHLLKTEKISQFQFPHLDFQRERRRPADRYHAFSLHGGGETDCYLHIWPGREGEYPKEGTLLDKPLLLQIPPDYMLALRWDVIHAGHFVHPDDDTNTRFFAYLIPKKGFKSDMSSKFRWECDWKRHYNNNTSMAFRVAVPIISKK